MNFIPAALCRPEALRRLLPADFVLDRDLIVGVRPEHVTLVEEGDALFAGRVKFAEALGAETLIHLALEDGQMVTVRQAGDRPLPSGNSLCYGTCSPSAVSLFRASGAHLPAV